jgi:N-acetyl-anhydromuramyl-L-alanine amidase AmpD
MQYDFTNEQYESLIKLAAGVIRALPGIQLQVPSDAHSNVRTDLLTRSEIDSFSGIVAHWHLSKHKVDPGPAFDWSRFLTGVESILASREGTP